MGKAIAWGVLGLLLGVGIYPLISVFVFRTRVESGTSGCVGLALGIVIFAFSLWRDSTKKSKNTDKEKQ